MVVSDKEVNRKLYGLLPLSICHCPGFKEEGEYLWLSIEGEEKEEEEENGGVGGGGVVDKNTDSWMAI